MKLPMHKVLVVVAGFCFLWMLVSMWSGEENQVSLDQLAGNPFEVAAEDEAGEIVLALWHEPVSQDGGDWVFDIFTPPVIYYDEATQTFTVKSPYDRDNGAEDLRLIEIARQPYRLQLASYAGVEGNYVVTLLDRESGADVFCAPGEKLPGLDVSLREFKVKRVVPEGLEANQTEVFDWIGEAIIDDHRSGESFTLLSGQVTFGNDLLCVLQLPSGSTVSLGLGQSWIDQTIKYTLTHIDNQQQKVTLQESSLDGSDKRIKILQPSNSLSSDRLLSSNPVPGT